MAVHNTERDVVDVEKFGGIDFVIPLHSKRSGLVEVLARVKLMTRERGRELVRQCETFRRYDEPIDPQRFHVCSHVEFSPDDAEDRTVVRKWLLSLPISLNEEVYLYWKTIDWQATGCPAMVTTWRDLADPVWYYVWNRFSVMTVLDDSFSWMVVFGPEPFAVYAEAGPVPPGLPKSHPMFGLGLLRVRPGPLT